MIPSKLRIIHFNELISTFRRGFIVSNQIVLVNEDARRDSEGCVVFVVVVIWAISPCTFASQAHEISKNRFRLFANARVQSALSFI